MLSPIEQILVMVSMGALMIGMGTTLDWRSFKEVSKQPKHLLLGAGMQFGLLPLLAWSLAMSLSLSPEAALALVMVGCTPGGSSSNMYTWFAKGDVPLSLSMTMFSTILAVVLMPALVAFYGSQLPLGELVVPWKQIMGSLLFVLIPVAFGIFLKSKNVKYLPQIQKIGSALGISAVFLMLASWLPSLANKLLNEFAPEYLAVLLLGNCGFLLGYTLVRLFGFPATIARTISLETGLQNTLLTFTMMTLSFSTAFVDKVGWVPLMYGACIMGMGLFWMLLFRYLAIKEMQSANSNAGELTSKLSES
ncbi:MAG: bile acid:sodium symporter [Pseudomonadales bacterium]|nr:bile acid:sodium symporter [Pseudomonadales bacterium]